MEDREFAKILNTKLNEIETLVKIGTIDSLKKAVRICLGIKLKSDKAKLHFGEARYNVYNALIDFISAINKVDKKKFIDLYGKNMQSQSGKNNLTIVLNHINADIAEIRYNAKGTIIENIIDMRKRSEAFVGPTENNKNYEEGYPSTFDNNGRIKEES